MAFRGITPVVKQVAEFKLFLLGDGFAMGQDVTATLRLTLRERPARPITRYGKITKVFPDGAIALLEAMQLEDPNDEIVDDDVVIINVDVNGQTQQVIGGMEP